MSHTPTPISRDSMRALRAQTLEEQRKRQIHIIVSQIYGNTLGTAKDTNDSRHLYPLPEIQMRRGIENSPPDFHRTNMLEILAGVQSLFPDCSVEHTTMIMATARDGKTYDISKMDENLKPFLIHPGKSMEYIVVDWS
jgi:hypothetical protein